LPKRHQDRRVATSRPLLAVLPLLLVAACSSAGADERAPLEGCAPDRLTTLTPGRLTLSTGPVTRAPWVVGGEVDGRSPDPRQGRGYDAAVGYALAARLGFAREAVTWVSTPFAATLAEGDKPFDVNVNQVTITPERAQEVDLSTAYLVVPQAVVTLSNRPVARAEDLDGLRDATFAVLRGSAAERAIAAVRAPVPYDDPDDVRRAVSEDTQTALVTDLVTAMRLDADDQQLVDGELVGTLPVRDGEGEQFGLVLEKGSPLTSCVDAALEVMRDDGELAALQARWLNEETGWPQLR
jgi:polar amino acid transport system substrate-binding protein